ncbi:MAG: hypothetical protein QM606_03915 [Leucobacter sp.]
MLRQSLVWSGIATVVIGLIAGVIGALVAGERGVVSAVLGVVMAALYLGLTAVAMLIAARFDGPENIGKFFAVFLGGWALKMVVFIIAMAVLLGQEWLNGRVFFIAVLVNVVASMVIDVVVFARSRMPYVGDIELPGQSVAPASGREGGE